MSLPTNPRPWLFYRLGPTREKEFFKRRRDTYDGVVIPAHIASYYHKFCSEFVGALGKPYFIDPMTYIFANDPTQLKRFVKDAKTGRTKRDADGRKRKGDVKRSYAKLLERDYPGVVQAAVAGGRRLVPSDFANPTVMKDFTQKVVEFQRTRLAAIPDKYRKYDEYARKAGRPISATSIPPMCLVPPYFPTTTLQPRGWHGTNLQFVRCARTLAGGLPIFAVILADPQVLAQDVRRMGEDYVAAGADGFLLWPDGFSSDQDPAALQVVFDSTIELSKGGRPVLLMYGDAFSLTLHYAGLTGFACGICYGERKLSTQDIDATAIPPRYYIYRLKRKVIIETEARRIQIGRYADLVCDCDICRRKPEPADQDDTESREHFMLVRAAEIAELRRGLSQAEFAAALDASFQRHRDDPLLQPIGHLKNWAALLAKAGSGQSQG